MHTAPRALALALASSITGALLGELPLPDAILYGKITARDGAPVGSGALKARVRRGAASFEAPGGFKQAEGGLWYIIKIPLETSIGAPGPTGTAAREGDTIEGLLLDGRPLELSAEAPALRAGQVSRIDAAAGAGTGSLIIFRGDCSPDLRVDISDALRVLSFLFISPGPPPCLEACDADGNGTLNITDGIALLSYLFLGGPAPAAPGPQCAPLTAPTSLGCAASSCL
jgi:hypothetical protein